MQNATFKIDNVKVWLLIIIVMKQQTNITINCADNAVKVEGIRLSERRYT